MIPHLFSKLVREAFGYWSIACDREMADLPSRFSNGEFPSSDPSLNLTAESRQSFDNICSFFSFSSLSISCMYCCCPLSHIWTLCWQRARPDQKTNSFTCRGGIASLRHDISKELIQTSQTIKEAQNWFDHIEPVQYATHYSTLYCLWAKKTRCGAHFSSICHLSWICIIVCHHMC